jgi:hypothetical protein
MPQNARAKEERHDLWLKVGFVKGYSRKKKITSKVTQ